MIVIAQFGTATETTAKLTLPRDPDPGGRRPRPVQATWRRRRPGRRPRSGSRRSSSSSSRSPFLVAGEATWAGYIKLDDNATWLAITEPRLRARPGPRRSAARRPTSRCSKTTWAAAYPIGGFVPMAVMSKISGQDVAFTLQPSMAVAAVMMALLLFELARRLVQGVGASALIAIVASLSALFLGYYLWGGVKELVTAALLPLGPVLAGLATARRGLAAARLGDSQHHDRGDHRRARPRWWRCGRFRSCSRRWSSSCAATGPVASCGWRCPSTVLAVILRAAGDLHPDRARSIR